MSLSNTEERLKVLRLASKPEPTAEQIRSAYLTLCKEHHPDIDTSDGAADRFLKIQEAYQALTQLAPSGRAGPPSYYPGLDLDEEAPEGQPKGRSTEVKLKQREEILKWKEEVIIRRRKKHVESAENAAKASEVMGNGFETTNSPRYQAWERMVGKVLDTKAGKAGILATLALLYGLGVHFGCEG